MLIPQKEWFTMDYAEIAGRIAKNITIREYGPTGSYDEQRESTPEEFKIIFNVVKGMCSAYGWNSEEDEKKRLELVDNICDMGEFVLMNFLPKCNTYDTLYGPFKRELGVW